MKKVIVEVETSGCYLARAEYFSSQNFYGRTIEEALGSLYENTEFIGVRISTAKLRRHGYRVIYRTCVCSIPEIEPIIWDNEDMCESEAVGLLIRVNSRLLGVDVTTQRR